MVRRIDLKPTPLNSMKSYQKNLETLGLATNLAGLEAQADAVPGATAVLEERLGEGNLNAILQKVAVGFLEEEDPAVRQAAIALEQQAAKEEELLRNIAMLNYVERAGAKPDPFAAIAAEISPNVARMAEMRRKERLGGARELFQNLGLINRLRSDRATRSSVDRRQALALKAQRVGFARDILKAVGEDATLTKRQKYNQANQLMQQAGVGSRQENDLAIKEADREMQFEAQEQLARNQQQRALELEGVKQKNRMALQELRGEQSAANIKAQFDNWKQQQKLTPRKMSNFNIKFKPLVDAIKTTEAEINRADREATSGFTDIGEKIAPEMIDRIKSRLALQRAKLNRLYKQRRDLWNKEHPNDPIEYEFPEGQEPKSVPAGPGFRNQVPKTRPSLPKK